MLFGRHLFFLQVSTYSVAGMSIFIRTHNPGVHEQFVLQLLTPSSIELDALQGDKVQLTQQTTLAQEEIKQLKQACR